MCGEKNTADLMDWASEGSPPRVRGKEKWLCRDHGQYRITPACAGKSSELMSKSGTSGDHPRVCGEKSPMVICAGCCKGSPPRVRGKGYVKATRASRRGITPACAGKSHLVTRRDDVIRDHPRVRGEKILSQSACLRSIGSPPRTQGKVTSRTQRALRSAGRPTPVPPLQTRIMVISPRP